MLNLPRLFYVVISTRKKIIRTELSTENITVLEKNIGSIPTVTVLQIKS